MSTPSSAEPSKIESPFGDEELLVKTRIRMLFICNYRWIWGLRKQVYTVLELEQHKKGILGQAMKQQY